MTEHKKKILVADPSKKTLELITHSPLHSEYEFKFVSDGVEFMRTIKEFKPDLVFIELLLPKHHGIELLKWMKSESALNQIGVIIMTFELIQQNYRATYEFGADFFLEKPFDLSTIKKIIHKYFDQTLKQEPFSGHHSIDLGLDSYYDPKYEQPKNYIKFWGTRGSSAVSGGDYIKFGGNTSCLEVRYGKDVVLIDAGTGIRSLGEHLVDEDDSNLHLFMSHTHLDHVVGFPFFLPLYMDKTKLNIYSPIGYEKETKELFTDLLAYSFFPVRLDQMHAHVKFNNLHESDKIVIGDIEISSCYTYHPGATLGFKITTPTKKIAYITDNEFLVGFHGHPDEVDINHPGLENHWPLIEFIRDCDVIVHEAQYFPIEYLKRVGWGHSSMINASLIFKFVQCPHWIVTHHDPRHTDSDLNYKAELHRKILKDYDLFCHLRYAYDGMIYPL
jgi:ribonuclease BN (tRNA processing enzyme)/CheY-like chemotaxis protein